MGQSQEVHGTGQWYLIARHGDMVMRVRPRMLLGETASGELSFEASCAQLELDIDDDGGLVLSAVDGHELEWAGGTRCYRERLARHRGAEIRLAHNVLILDTDFVEDVSAPRPIENATEPDPGRIQERFPGRPAAVVTDVESRTLEADAQAIVEEDSKEVPIEPDRARRLRIPSRSMAAVIALSAVGLGLLYFGLGGDTAPGPDDVVGGEPPQIASPQAAATVATSSEQQRDDVLPSAVVPSPPQPPPLHRDESPSSEPVPEQVATLPAKAASIDVYEASPAMSEREPAAAPAAEPVVQQRLERTSVPKVAETTVADQAVAVAKTTNIATVDTVAKRAQPQKDEKTKKEASELARRRALFAADQAFAQGRLTTPPERNAYTLYNRVLALDPESPEARNGLKSVREKLINRALAELAGNALDDARRSLETAAEVGADPSLVANLQAEVAYRQQLVNARRDNE